MFGSGGEDNRAAEAADRDGGLPSRFMAKAEAAVHVCAILACATLHTALFGLLGSPPEFKEGLTAPQAALVLAASVGASIFAAAWRRSGRSDRATTDAVVRGLAVLGSLLAMGDALFMPTSRMTWPIF